MRDSPGRGVIPVLLLFVVLWNACTPAARTPAGGEISQATQPRHTLADVQFMHGMIAHHAQAILMTDLVAGRSGSDDIRRLAQRIAISQQDELKMMRRWLEARGETVPDTAGHHTHAGHAVTGGAAAPVHGMLSGEELARLAAASGAAFDRLFLEHMIRHHEGALTMVAELFATDGAAQETEIFRFASHVDSDQRIEIARMRRMLGARS